MKIFNDLKYKDSYFNSTGYFASVVEGKPVDQSGNEVPWMNYSIVKLLKERLEKNMSLFEYGSGFSTKFYAKHVSKVTSVEHDENWFKMVSRDKPSNCEILHVAYDPEKMGGEYSQTALNQEENFDVIVVDGRDRVNCIKNSMHALTENGIIILDDSSRNKYKEAFDFMLSHDFKQINFCGLKSSGRKEDCTTIFYRRNNCFDI